MSELTITLLRLGYLALLWMFVLTSVGVLRKDIYGMRITPRATKGPRRTGTGSPAPTAAPTKLVVVDGPLTGTTLPLSTSPILIGRAASCSLVLDDGYTSTRHARIFPQGSAWVLEDLGSTNGTFVGDHRVAEPQVLPIDTPVRIGQSILELRR
ncbi:MAG: FHA domain-containing protein FhaB/FipA [Cellulomonadaceae bacterium]